MDKHCPYIQDRSYFWLICNIAIINIEGPKTTLRTHYQRAHNISSISFKSLHTKQLSIIKRVQSRNKFNFNRKINRLEKKLLKILYQLEQSKLCHQKMIRYSNWNCFLVACNIRCNEEEFKNQLFEDFRKRSNLKLLDAIGNGCYNKGRNAYLK